MKKKKESVLIGVIATMCCAVVGGTIYIGQAWRVGKVDLSRKTPLLDSDTKSRFANELKSVIREDGEPAARQWLLEHGAGLSAQVVLSFDNSNDVAGTVRTSLLGTIYSISSEDLPEEELRAWAAALRELASVVLHDGPDRMDYVAKSFIMEGRDQDAAAEYAHFPDSPQAAHFFRQNPSLRMPASGAK